MVGIQECALKTLRRDAQVYSQGGNHLQGTWLSKRVMSRSATHAKCLVGVRTSAQTVDLAPISGLKRNDPPP